MQHYVLLVGRRGLILWSQLWDDCCRDASASMVEKVGVSLAMDARSSAHPTKKLVG